MKRRTFLKSSALAGCTGLLPLPAVFAHPAVPRAYAHPELLQLLDDADAVAAIGSAYLRANPAKHDTDALLSALDQRLDSVKANAAPQALKRSVKRDFTRGETRRLNGWILAETEALQCALFSLTRA